MNIETLKEFVELVGETDAAARLGTRSGLIRSVLHGKSTPPTEWLKALPDLLVRAVAEGKAGDAEPKATSAADTLKMEAGIKAKAKAKKAKAKRARDKAEKAGEAPPPDEEDSDEAAGDDEEIIDRGFGTIKQNQMLVDMEEDGCYSMRLHPSHLGVGTFYIEYTGKQKRYTQIANFACVIKREVTVIGGALGAVGKYEIEAHVAGRKPFTFLLEKEDYPNVAKWVEKHLGARAILNGAGKRRMDEAIKTVSNSLGNIENTEKFSEIGFRKHAGELFYIHAGGCIGPQTDIAGPEMEIVDKLMDFKLPAKVPTGSALKEAWQVSTDFIAAGLAEKTMPIWLYTFLPLFALPEFAFWFYGESGTFKSSCAAIMQQHYGRRMHRKNLPENWASTRTSIEKRLFEVKDALCVVDNYSPSVARGAGRNYAAEVVNNILLLYGDGSNRHRQDSNLRDRVSFKPRGALMATAEETPPGQAASARTFVMQLNLGDIDKNKLTPIQEAAAAGKLAGLTASITQWIVDNYTAEPRVDIRREFEAGLAGRRDEVDAKLQGIDLHARHYDTINTMLRTYDMLARFADDHGLVMPIDRQKTVDAFLTHAGTQSVEHLDETLHVKYLDQLSSNLAAGEWFVENGDQIKMMGSNSRINGVAPPPPFDPGQLGWRRSGESWQRQNGAKAVGWVQSSEPGAVFLNTSMIKKAGDIDVSAEKAGASLDEGGHLFRTNPGRKTLNRKIRGNSQRVIAIKSESLTELLNPSEHVDGEDVLPFTVEAYDAPDEDHTEPVEEEKPAGKDAADLGEVAENGISDGDDVV